MKHPPYHLRINKNVDRFLLIELLQKLNIKYPISEYTYFGFGGPLLEDFRLLRDFFCDLKMVSLEKNNETFKRQQFNRFTKKIQLIKKDVNSFLTHDFKGKGKEIFWLDYTDNYYKRFVEFNNVLSKVGEFSVVKITMPALFRDNPFGRLTVAPSELTREQTDFLKRFNDEYRNVLPENLKDGEYFYRDRPIELLPIMVRIAAQKALPTSGGVVFRCLNVAHYRDGMPMISVAGITCPVEESANVDSLFTDWMFNSIDWSASHKIDMPILSLKEILLLESHLPTEAADGNKTATTLGYIIDEDPVTSLEKLRQYENFYRFYPRFIKAHI